MHESRSDHGGSRYFEAAREHRAPRELRLQDRGVDAEEEHRSLAQYEARGPTGGEERRVGDCKLTPRCEHATRRV